MIVVDTTVWIDYLRGTENPHTAELASLIEEDAGVALTDVILTEILQGVRDERQARTVERHLQAFDILRLDSIEDFTRGAELYRIARRAGHTVRRTLDCLIASICVRESVPILHKDADFDRLAQATRLTVHPPRP